MQTELRKALRDLDKGQLWKCAQGYLYIVEIGRRLIHYKLLKYPTQRAVLTRMSGSEAIQAYLRANNGELATVCARG